MAGEAKITIRSNFGEVITQLGELQKTAGNTGKSLNEATKLVGKTVGDQTAIVSGGMDRIRKMAGALAKQIGGDFKALLSLGSLAGGMKLSSQFSNTIKEAINLNDTIRKLAPIFGMNEAAASKFKQTLVKNLAEIGLGSDAAANALEGLGETNVRGDKQLTEYSTTAGKLASVSGEKGNEGAIAKGLAGTVTAEGKDVNDLGALKNVSDDVLRIRNATGKTASEALKTLEDLFSSANSQLKSRLAGGGGVSLATAQLVGGKDSTDYLKSYLGMDGAQRAGAEAQGLGHLVGEKGELNPKEFQKTIQEANRRSGGMGTEMGLRTMGMSDEQAKGFLRLSEALKINAERIEGARTATVDLGDEYERTMSMGDAFKANINRVKGGLSELTHAVGLGDAINGTTNALEKTSHTGAGATAIVAGSAMMAAMLSRFGLKGIGGLLGGEAAKAGIEGITGEKVQRVEVINWPASMGGLDVGGLASKIPGMGGFGAGAASAAGGAVATNAGGWSVPAAGMAETAMTGGAVAAMGATSTVATAIAALPAEIIAALAVGTGYVASKATEYAVTGGAEDTMKALYDWLVGADRDSKKASEGYRGAVPAIGKPQDVNIKVISTDPKFKAFKSGSKGASN